MIRRATRRRSMPSATARSATSASWTAFDLYFAHELLPKTGAHFSGSCASHRRIEVISAERVQAEGRTRDVEVEREVLVHRDHIAQMPLDRIAHVEPLRAVAGP